MHTGIATGLVVARRSDARAGDFALTGDAVNTAARLRSAAAARRGHRRRDDLAAGVRRLRGRTDRPAGAEGQGAAARRLSHPRRARGAADRDAGLVGRDEELRDFGALAEACAQRRRSRVVIVRGDPGVGKSRLVAEFVARARGARASRATARRCSTSAPRPAATRCAASRAACSASTARRRRGGARHGDRARARWRGRWPPSAALPARPARRRAAGRAARARRGDEHDRARARLAARALRHRRVASARTAPLLLVRRGHPLGRRLDPRAPGRARRARRAAARCCW